MARSILRSILDKTVSHKRAVYTSDAGGGRTPNYSNVLATSVPASIWPMAANEAIANAFDRMDIVTTHAICTDRDLGVKADQDIIVHGTDIYKVAGAMKFENTLVANVTVYVVAADLRIA